MILTDGTTTVTIPYSDDSLSPGIEASVVRTAGGNLRRVRGGERFNMTSKVRVTPTEYRSLLDLLNTDTANYFFTPSETFADLYPDIVFPLNCVINGITLDWNNRKFYYVTLSIEGTSYV